MRSAIGLLVMVTWSVVCSYDYASSCARAGRGDRGSRAARLPPCDLARHSYCTTPGTNYPWHAIRRFVRENQGLMRRMYGEERHIAVLRAELDNFVEVDDEDGKKNGDFADDVMRAKMMYTKKDHGRVLRNRPHFRPIQNNNTEKHKKADNDVLKVKPLQTHTQTNNTKTNNADNKNKTEISNETLNDDRNSISYKTQLESIANVEINNLDPDVITLEAVIKQSIETNNIYPKFSEKAGENIVEESKNYTIGNDPIEESSVEVSPTETTTPEIQIGDTTTEPIKDNEWKPMSPDTSTLPPSMLFYEHEKNKNEKVEAIVADEKVEFHPKPGQHQEAVRPAVIKLRGANACESKEDLAAPFWANSTRGEILALLNMYPFEQYIHLETCVHEKKQMYCREGCRCEQQYRLHRLLAYDPHNECRGIFADWFKFPACCVCKCYDVPLEYRARSPRIIHPQYDAEIRRVIYNDVARDWYSSSYDDEHDDFY